MQPYHVAETYDTMTLRLLPYPAIAAHLAERLQAYAPRLHTILDLACGTGNLTLPLAQLGYRMKGLDIAPQMLAIACAKAAASQQAIDYRCQDMRQPYQGATLDAVTCFYGGLNFLSTTEALRQGFTTAFHALQPGGLFAFDLFSVDKMRTLFSGTRAADYGDFYVVTKSTCDEAGQITHGVTFFLRNGEDGYRREEEVHQIRIHPLAQIQGLLAEVGFQLCSVEALYPQVNAKLLQDVSLVIAQKPGEGDRNA